MSQYLTIRKNDVNIFSFSRNSKEYQALINYSPYTEEWESLNKSDITQAISDLNSDRKNILDKINVSYEALKYLKEDRAIYDALNTIGEYKEEIEEIDWSICTLNLVVDMYDIPPFDGDTEPNEVIMQYSIR